MEAQSSKTLTEGSIIIMYGCPPNGTTLENSDMTVELFQKFW
jgi:hypothetical protein